MFKASRYLAELQNHRPDIVSACRAAMASKAQDLTMRVGRSAFVQCPSELIDYAVMEKTSDAVVVPMNAGWSDIGFLERVIGAESARQGWQHGDR